MTDVDAVAIKLAEELVQFYKPTVQEAAWAIEPVLRERDAEWQVKYDALLAEVERLRDRLKAVETNRDRWRAGAEAEASAHDEVRDELDRLRTMPPEVAAAMESIKNKRHCYGEVYAVACYFTNLFTGEMR